MSSKTFDPKARANELAAQLKAAEEAEATYNATIDEAVKNAGRTRVEFVEALYEHFGIEAEMTARKDKDDRPVLDKNGSPVMVKTDKDETKRIAKLAAAFEQLVARAEGSGGGSKQEQQEGNGPSNSAPAPSKPTPVADDPGMKKPA